MVVLALETVTRAGGIALCIDGTCEAVSGDSARTHAERLPGEMLACLARHGRHLHDVDRFAVISGPGSFTGLRVGIAAIQGLAIANDRKIVPLPTLEAMALAWQSVTPEPRASVVVACLDGQRGEVFNAGWRVRRGATMMLDDADIVLTPRVSRPAVLAADVRSLAVHGSVVIIGDGARRHADVLDRGVEIADVPAPLALIAARFGAAHPELAVPPHALRPIYIRRPDAVLARERADEHARVPRP